MLYEAIGSIGSDWPPYAISRRRRRRESSFANDARAHDAYNRRGIIIHLTLFGVHLKFVCGDGGGSAGVNALPLF